MPTEKKRMIVAQLAERLSRAKLLAVTAYRGMNMKEMTAVRRSLERSGIGFHVVKKTLFLRALGEAGIAGLDPFLEGPIAVAFAYEDPISAARALQDQGRDFPILQVKAAWMDGQVLTAADVDELATLPPRPILLGRVVGAVQSPVAGVVDNLAAVLRQLVYVLQARAKLSAEAA